MVSFKEHGNPATHLYQPHLHSIPKLLAETAALPPSEVMWCAFNAQFDAKALALAGLPVPMTKWIDMMLLASVLSFSGGLDSVLAQFNVVDSQGRPCTKSPEGKALIRRFSVQQQPWFDAPEEWSRFTQYCRQDVDIEAALLSKCLQVLDNPSLAPAVRRTHQQWLLDQRMNATGMPISRATVDGAIRLKAVESKRLVARLKALTGLANPNSTQQLHTWLEAQGHSLPDLQAQTVREALLGPEVPEDVAAVLQARLELGKSSVKKYDAIARMEVGGRVRNGYTTCGASRTGRTASRGINLSNLERPKIKGALADTAADIIEFGDPDLLPMLLPGPAGRLSAMEVLGSCIRGAIAAPPGKVLNAADLKSIESVGAAWLAGCTSILDLFHEGKDTYRDFATKHYGIAYDDVTSEQRTFCKPVILGENYGASGPALVDYAAGMGIVIPMDEADAMVETFRTAFPEIPLYWKSLEDAAKRAITQPGTAHLARACAGWTDYGPLFQDWPRVSYYCDGMFLYCGLPSGRTLFYYKPEIRKMERISRKTGEPYWASSISYMGKRQDAGGAWQRITTWGAGLFENSVQAICRDVLYHGLELAHQDPGIEIVGSTYDEIIFLSNEADGQAPFDRMVGHMTTLPPWADSRFYLAADGFTAKRYKK